MCSSYELNLLVFVCRVFVVSAKHGEQLPAFPEPNFRYSKFIFKTETGLKNLKWSWARYEP